MKSQDVLARCSQHVARDSDRVYENTKIDGNATVVVGDNHGTLITHHHHQPISEDSKYNKMLIESLTFETMGARLRNINPALSRTCSWLREHKNFISWINPDRLQGFDDFLWLKGKPGSGKSTIMRNTFVWLGKEYPTHIAVSYFFDARSPFLLAKSALGLYRAVLHQLVTSCAEIKNLFLDKFADKLMIEKIEPWTEEEIQNFLIEMIDSGHPHALTIFIDALDESKDADLQEMIAFLEDLQQRAAESGVRLRICLSSRHYPHVSISGKSVTIEEELGHGEDIDRYVRTRLLGGETTELEEVRHKLLSKAAGIFLWIVLIIPSLNRLYNRGEGLTAMIRELERASPKIQDLFYNMLTRDPDEIEDCITLLQLVLYAKRPLSPIELYRAIKRAWTSDYSCVDMTSITYDTISRYLLTCSRGLVEFTKSSSPSIQFVHETVRETLLNIDLAQTPGDFRANFGLLNFQPEVCNALITETCLQCLLGLAAKEVEVRPRTRYELVDTEGVAAYSAEFWWQHILETTGDRRQLVLKLSSKLLTVRQTRQMWVRLYDIDQSIEGLETLRDYGSPLYYAASVNLWESVNEYIAAGTNVNIKGGRMDTPLGAAAYWGHKESVKVLLEAGANVDEELTQSDGLFAEFSPLIAAVRQNHKDVVAMLLNYGAQVDRVATYRTAICEAVKTGDVNMVRLLLEYGADVNVNHFQNTWHVPVHISIEDGYTNIASLLLEHGAEVSSEDLGRYLGHYVYNTLNWSMIKLLLKWNAEIKPYNFEYYHTLFIKHNKLDLASMLEEAYARSASSRSTCQAVT